MPRPNGFYSDCGCRCCNRVCCEQLASESVHYIQIEWAAVAVIRSVRSDGTTSSPPHWHVQIRLQCKHSWRTSLHRTLTALPATNHSSIQSRRLPSTHPLVTSIRVAVWRYRPHCECLLDMCTAR